MNHFASRIAGLDGIRALAVCAVVWDHMYVSSATLPVTSRGYLGVDVFFVLSGFLITGLLLREREQKGQISLRNFFLRRTLRIFPLYYSVVALVAIYFVFVPGSSAQRGAYLDELPHHLTYTSNWIDLNTMMGITWSLATEEQFYLLWPLLFFLFGRKAIALLVPALLFNQAINFGVLDAWFDSIGFPYAALEIMQCTFTPIILGVMLAFALPSLDTSSAMHKFLTARFSGVALCVLVIVLANWPGEFRGLPRLAFQFVVACTIARVVLTPASTLVRFLDWRPIAFVGGISYGVYLLHVLVIHAVDKGLAFAHFHGTALRFMLTLLGSIALAALSYRYFELPFLRLKEKIQ